jgi:uncharacterized damage-inducible protein DinB
MPNEEAFMIRSILMSVVLACAAAAAVRAQSTYPFIAELRQNYTIVKNNHLRMADKMPEDHYGFRPVDSVRSFSEAVAHVADAQALSCSLVNGESKVVDAKSKTSKADLVAALKASYAICDAAFEALGDAGASQMVRLGQSTRERSKLGLLAGVISHSNEQYGYLSVYLRLKGIVPPSSEAR